MNDKEFPSTEHTATLQDTIANSADLEITGNVTKPATEDKLVQTDDVGKDDVGNNDGESSDDSFVEDTDWEQPSHSKQRRKHPNPRKRATPRRIVTNKTLSLRKNPTKIIKQQVKKKVDPAVVAVDRKRKLEEFGKMKLKDLRKQAKAADPTENDAAQPGDAQGKPDKPPPKPRLGRPKKNLEYRNLNTLALECKYCFEQFKGIAELINHVSMIHNDKEDYKKFIEDLVGKPYKDLFVCELCGMIFRQVYWLRRHVRQEHKEESEFETYMMKLGGKILPNAAQKARKTYHCKFCSMSSPTGFDVYEHMKMKHSDEPEYKAAETEICDAIRVKCKLCDKTFLNPKYISTHMKLTHSNETHVCCICNSVFKNKYLLKGHMKAVHMDKKDKLKLMCDRCPSTFSNVHKLQMHIRQVSVFPTSKHDTLFSFSRLTCKAIESENKTGVH